MADPRVQTIRNQLYNRGAWTAWEALDSLARDASRVAALETALREIAGYDHRNTDTGCRCGHRMDMCHVVNSERWCRGGTSAIARHALGDCPPVCWVCIRADALAGSGTEPAQELA